MKVTLFGSSLVFLGLSSELSGIVTYNILKKLFTSNLSHISRDEHEWKKHKFIFTLERMRLHNQIKSTPWRIKFLMMKTCHMRTCSSMINTTYLYLTKLQFQSMTGRDPVAHIEDCSQENLAAILINNYHVKLHKQQPQIQAHGLKIKWGPVEQ